MIDARRELAVLNNVCWYQAMFRAHRLATDLDDLVWSSAALPPPFHSNLVVLSPAVDMPQLRGRLDVLENALPAPGYSMKDSFATLEVGALGFELLFEAKWIWREASQERRACDPEAWIALTNPEVLQAWEQAWWGESRDLAAGQALRQFPASLMESPHHRFFARWDGGRIVAGAIANRSPGVVGLSNAFRLGAPVFDEWSGLIRCASEHFPGLPLVGFERGQALQASVDAGFIPTGALRVWERRP